MSLYPFTRPTVEALSAFKNEPSWMTSLRLSAWDQFSKSGTAALPKEFFAQPLQAFSEPPVKPVPSSDWPEDLQHALDERGDEEGLIIQRDATTLSRSITKEQSKKGVLYTDLDTAVKMYPDLVQRYLGKQAAVASPLGALNTALMSGGTFLYVPPHVEVLLPFHTCYWMSAPERTPFPHSLVIAEAGSTVSLVDDFVSLEWKEFGWAVGAVEATARERARFRYYQFQNWSTSVPFESVECFDVARSATLLSFHAEMGARGARRELTLDQRIDGESHQMKTRAEAAVTPEMQAMLDYFPDDPIREKVLQYVIGKVQGHRKPVTLERAAQLHPEYR